MKVFRNDSRNYYQNNHSLIILSWPLLKTKLGDLRNRKRKAITGDALFFLQQIKIKIKRRCLLFLFVITPRSTIDNTPSHDTSGNQHKGDWSTHQIFYFGRYVPPNISHKTCVCTYSVIQDFHILRHKYRRTFLSRTKCVDTNHTLTCFRSKSDNPLFRGENILTRELERIHSTGLLTRARVGSWRA